MPSPPAPTKPKTATPSRGARAAQVATATPQRMFERVAADIRARIAEGRIKPGERFPGEREFALELNVSRSTVREALRSLENAGLVVMRRGPGGGVFVASQYAGGVRNGMSDLLSLGLVNPEHLGEARVIIGTAVARLAAERRSYGDLEALSQAIEQTSAALKAGDSELWMQLSFEFHHLLAKSTQNPALVILTDAVIELNHPMVQAAGMRDPRKGLLFRRRMLGHLERRDADAAATEVQRYLGSLPRYYRTRLEG